LKQPSGAGGNPPARIFKITFLKGIKMVLSSKLIARYRELKPQEPDCLLLMQVGAFLQVKFDIPNAKR